MQTKIAELSKIGETIEAPSSMVHVQEHVLFRKGNPKRKKSVIIRVCGDWLSKQSQKVMTGNPPCSTKAYCFQGRTQVTLCSSFFRPNLYRREFSMGVNQHERTNSGACQSKRWRDEIDELRQSGRWSGPSREKGAGG